MSQLDPANTTVGDLCLAAMKLSGYIGVGRSPLAEDYSDAWAMLQWMLQEWASSKRYLVFHLVTVLATSTGAVSYTVGDGGSFNTGAGSVRPDKIESAFLRQFASAPANTIDFPLDLLQSMEDYNLIALKGLVSFPVSVFYDPTWESGVGAARLGRLYVYPVAQASIYAIGLTLKAQLPTKFAALTTAFNIPYIYYNALHCQLALRLRGKYQIPTFPGDPLPGMARDALAAIRAGNAAIARLRTPADMTRPGIYNIFSDRSY